MKRLLLYVSLALLAFPRVGLAVYPMPHLQTPPLTSYPCDAASHPCNACTAFSKDEAFQVQQAVRSSRSNQTPNNPFGNCAGSHDWCLFAPQISSATYFLTTDDNGLPAVRFTVEYDLPNNYCLVWDEGDSCAASYWPARGIGFAAHLTRVKLSEGATEIYNAPAMFENGLWMPTLSGISCDGSTHIYTVTVTNGGGFAGCGIPAFAIQNIVVTLPASNDPSCKKPDPRNCPGCGPDGGGQ